MPATTGDPQEAIEIGADENSCVGNYAGPAPFTGLIDEVRLFTYPLSADEVKRLLQGSFKTISPNIVARHELYAILALDDA